MLKRHLYASGVILITLILLVSLYLQFFAGIIPCPLCTLQRLCFVLLGILFFIGFFLYKRPTSRSIVNSLILIVIGLGMVLAGRQIWLQHFAPPGGECGVSLQYMVQVFPLHEVAQKVFSGSAECSQRGWEFLYLDMAEWAFVWFGVFLLLMMRIIFKTKN